MVNKGLIWIQKIGSRQTKDSTFTTIANPGKTKAQELQDQPFVMDVQIPSTKIPILKILIGWKNVNGIFKGF